MRSSLCRRYHDISAYEELKSRIIFEVVHDIVDESCLFQQYGWVYSSRRDIGHQQRIYNLMKAVWGKRP
jgi:hypothetical protein